MKEKHKTWQHAPGDEFPWQYKYEHSAVTNDCVIFTFVDSSLKVLLIQRGEPPFKGSWALPGGFLRTTESARQGAIRELYEETNLGLTLSSPMTQFGVFSDPRRDPRERVITIAWYAIVRPSEVHGGSDADKAAWFDVDNLPPLAFDHGKILRAALERLKRDIYFEPIGFELLDEEFTLPDLRRAYEKILGREFDSRNFQRKMLASRILEDTGRKNGEDLYSSHSHTSSRVGRTAPLYKLNRAEYDKMKSDDISIEF